LDREGAIAPSAMGKLCRWESPRPAMTYASYKDFHHSLSLKCEKEPEAMASLLRSTNSNNPSIVKFVPDNTMPETLYYQSFMARHLGGKIHLTNYCYDSPTMPQDITTFRPSLREHFGLQTNEDSPRQNAKLPDRTRRRKIPAAPREVLSQSESRVRSGPYDNTRESDDNRRIDYDDDAYDYDVNDFESDMDLYNKCKNKATFRSRGRSLNDGAKDMPTFEHFPMRDIMKVSGLDSRSDDFPSDKECRNVLEPKIKKMAIKESEFPSLFSFLPSYSNQESEIEVSSDSEGFGDKPVNKQRTRVRQEPITRVPIQRVQVTRYTHCR
jgi:hypothetical protein